MKKIIYILSAFASFNFASQINAAPEDQMMINAVIFELTQAHGPRVLSQKVPTYAEDLAAIRPFFTQFNLTPGMTFEGHFENLKPYLGAAYFQIGVNYNEGKNGLQKNPTKALGWFEKAAVQGFKPSPSERAAIAAAQNGALKLFI